MNTTTNIISTNTNNADIKTIENTNSDINTNTSTNINTEIVTSINKHFSRFLSKKRDLQKGITSGSHPSLLIPLHGEEMGNLMGE
jgi:hypothetical protein